MKILIASNNQKKLKELLVIVETANLNLEIVTPNQLGIDINPIENGTTLEANAKIKAQEFYDASNLSTIADDTGLEVESLNGKPGVYSARYAGENANDAENRIKLLKELTNVKNRQARFRTVICYVERNNYYFFKGVCEGSICQNEIGENGFGYDSVFIPKGYNQTFAELNPDIKNTISHRAKALSKLVDFLKNKVD